MPKSPKLSKKSVIRERKFARNLLFISLSALFIKIFIIFRIQGFDWYQAGNGDLARGLGELLNNNYAPPNIWLGADGENYLQGLQGLVTEGFYSEEGKLSYWPAGYPLLMWPIIELFRGYFFLILALLQTFLYTFASIWFVEEIRKTRVNKSSYVIAIFLAFNPTVSMNTISIGYELPVVSLSLISLGSLLRILRSRDSKILRLQVVICSVSLSLATFMQPRLFVIALAFCSLWAAAKYRLKLAIPFLAFTLGVVAIAPAVLVFRNQEANGFAAISTNLGVTMRLGAGPETSGGYSNSPTGIVVCPETKGDASEVDGAIVKCVLDWYLDNPSKALVLFWNKARFFWSPWFGPEANGTMARNPWVKIHPLKSAIQTPEGFQLVFGGFGRFISWIWMLSGLALLVKGFSFLWRLGDVERLLALISGSGFFINIVSSMLTIGDHRFRIPTMAMSLFLQALGIHALFSKKELVPIRPEPLLSWQLLRRVGVRAHNL